MEKNGLKTTVKVATTIAVVTGIIATGAIIASTDAIKGFLKNIKKAKDVIDETNNNQVIYKIKENDEGNQTLELQNKD